MPFFVVKICVPADISHAPPFLPGLISPKSSCSRLVALRNLKSHISALISKPKNIFGNERKNFLISYRILVAYYQKLFSAFYQLCYILSEKAERRIRTYYVGFIQQLNAFLASEVASRMVFVAF